ncbi:unnamed protein product [Rotaria socialis]
MQYLHQYGYWEFSKLPNSNIYLKLHSILTLLFKSLRLLEFIFAVILYIERVTFLSSHSIQHYFRSKYSLQVSFNFQKLLSPKSFTLTIFQKYSSQSKCKSENALFRSTCRTEEYFSVLYIKFHSKLNLTSKILFFAQITMQPSGISSDSTLNSIGAFSSLQIINWKYLLIASLHLSFFHSDYPPKQFGK